MRGAHRSSVLSRRTESPNGVPQVFLIGHGKNLSPPAAAMELRLRSGHTTPIARQAGCLEQRPELRPDGDDDGGGDDGGAARKRTPDLRTSSGAILPQGISSWIES